jgi:hypothetical protein
MILWCVSGSDGLLLRPWCGARPLWHGLDRHRNRTADRGAMGIRDLAGGDGVDECGERAPHVAVGRQRMQDCQANLLGHIVGRRVAAVEAAQPGPAVAEHGGPQQRHQRFCRGRVATRSAARELILQRGHPGIAPPLVVLVGTCRVP